MSQTRAYATSALGQAPPWRVSSLGSLREGSCASVFSVPDSWAGSSAPSSRAPAMRSSSATPAAGNNWRRWPKRPAARPRGGTPAEAADGADAVLLAVHWLRVDDVLKQAGNLT